MDLDGRHVSCALRRALRIFSLSTRGRNGSGVVDGLERGFGLQAEVSAHGLDQPLQFACLLVETDDLGALHADPDLQLLLDERAGAQGMGRRAVTPGTRREAQLGEAAPTGRLGPRPLARRPRQQSEGKIPRAGCGM